MSQDIILITIDALRYDATSYMPNVRSRFNNESQADVITAGAATNWVFPAILSGSYYTNAYNDEGLVRDNWLAISDILSDEGYSTAAFLGFNPYLGKWSDHFDRFWNGGITDSGESWYSNPLQKWMSRGYRTVLLKKRVSAEETISRALQWYEDQSHPRFLWVHLMEPHKPYYPGLSKGREVGLINAYRSILSLQRNGDDTPQKQIQTQRKLYEQCVKKVDSDITFLLDAIDDDAATIIMGDHGEEFDHGHYGHERLYDECVRIPLFVKNVLDDMPETVRQIDIPVELLNDIGINPPKQWDGEQFGTAQATFMMTPRPSEDTFQCALRTPVEKLIQTYDRKNSTIIRNEYYNLTSDPKEMDNRYEKEDVSKLKSELRDFMESHQSALEIDPKTGEESDAIEDRLKHLGYR